MSEETLAPEAPLDPQFEIKKVIRELGEDVVKAVISKVVKPYGEHLIKSSENKIDDLALPFLGQIEAGLLALADKIDGEEG